MIRLDKIRKGKNNLFFRFIQRRRKKRESKEALTPLFWVAIDQQENKVLKVKVSVKEKKS